ncbi:hypothetical protein ACE1TI_14140 [Alteribacillus sp. JSM 102045]|uniref:hypothetical protein n=1 Tax=Alteribacillus sp. JSM 102045 TaxID=1562101 RepID=UPI0035BEFB29
MFSAESNETASLLPAGTTITVKLPPLTTAAGESIKLDSFARIYFETTNSTSHSLEILYVLQRSGDSPETEQVLLSIALENSAQSQQLTIPTLHGIS